MKNNNCGIYCIENIVNHKKYIGLSRDITRRWWEHKSELRRNTHDNQFLQASWNKYGEENFIFYIITLCNENRLSDLERHYIEFYHTLSHENGYNLTPGGENLSGGKKVISLTSLKIYNYVKEAALDNDVCDITMILWCQTHYKFMYYEEYISLSEQERIEIRNTDFEQIKHEKLSKAHSKENLSNETLLKLKERLTGSTNPRAQSVYCPQLDEYFACIKYASEKYHVNQGSIGQCIKGKLKSAGIHPITGERLTWVKIDIAS